MTSGTVLLTTNEDQFMDSLKPGDLLLFDSVHMLSELIKFAENRPVNHCGVYLGNKEFAEVRGHVRAADLKAPPSVAAARKSSLADQLTKGPLYDRTVTALRHTDAPPDGAKAVAERAFAYIDAKDSKYHYLSLIALMVPSLFRTYETYFTKKKTESLATMLRVFSQSVLDAFESEGKGSSGTGGTRKTLTCSEFVYRCFDEADPRFRISVERPLGTWITSAKSLSQAVRESDERQEGGETRTAFRGVGPRGAAGGTRSGVVSGEGLVKFDKSLKTNVAVVRGGSGTFETRGAWDIDKKDLAVLARDTIIEILKNNIRSKKYEPGRGTPAKKGEVVAEFITPRDLWSSASLRAESVLHRPAANDPDLDDLPPAPTTQPPSKA
jgi:hypothetical protein